MLKCELLLTLNFVLIPPRRVIWSWNVDFGDFYELVMNQIVAIIVKTPFGRSTVTWNVVVRCCTDLAGLFRHCGLFTSSRVRLRDCSAVMRAVPWIDFGMASAVTLDLTLCKTRIFEIGWIRQQHASKQEMHEFGRCTSAPTREFVVHDSTALWWSLNVGPGAVDHAVTALVPEQWRSWV